MLENDGRDARANIIAYFLDLLALNSAKKVSQICPHCFRDGPENKDYNKDWKANINAHILRCEDKRYEDRYTRCYFCGDLLPIATCDQHINNCYTETVAKMLINGFTKNLNYKLLECVDSSPDHNHSPDEELVLTINPGDSGLLFRDDVELIQSLVGDPYAGGTVSLIEKGRRADARTRAFTVIRKIYRNHQNQEDNSANWITGSSTGDNGGNSA
ncbi:hypothetical protein H0H92_008235 [Tricholoma furcatifolium]|nr:hypothetical protein H0H92_008235 [Tricholoma furcatifolium]